MYKVVVIEDEATVRQGIITTTDWSALNCSVVGEASNGEEGLECIRQLNPDLVISDVKMPRMDGVEMITQLRKEGFSCRFILLTAYSDFKYVQSALRLGASDYLLKPLREGTLEDAIHRIYEEEQQPPASLLSDITVSSRYVEEAISYIHQHYSRDINISQVSRFLSLSEGHLSRMFKKETGYTFTNYLACYRMECAALLLKDCRLKIYEVAARVGYSDTNYFSIQFKKIMGISPSEYQEHC